MKSNVAKTSCKRGFTLIELLVVVLIIGILAAVAVPKYKKAVAKSRTTEALSMLQSIRQAQEVYYLEKQTYAGDIALLDVEVPSNRIASTWMGVDVDSPRTYMYSCLDTGICSGAAEDANLPTLQYRFIHYYNSSDSALNNLPRGIPYCVILPGVRPKTDLAKEVCQSLSTKQPIESYSNLCYPLD